MFNVEGSILYRLAFLKRLRTPRESPMHYCQPISNERFRQQIKQKYGIKLGQ